MPAKSRWYYLVLALVMTLWSGTTAANAAEAIAAAPFDGSQVQLLWKLADSPP